jgi:hypothetical protein
LKKLKKMETNTIFNKAYQYLLLLVVLLLFSGCSSDDGPKDTINMVQPALTSFTELNTCDIGGCCLATEFDFSISYAASDGTEIARIEFELEWSDGDTDENSENDFSDTGSNVTYDWCYRFGETIWVDITHILVSTNGAKSSPITVRLMKPDGAN